MTPDQIEAAIRSGDAADLDMDTSIQIYSHVLAVLASSIAPSELRRLILIGAAMFKCMNQQPIGSLQAPAVKHTEEDEPPRGLLH